MADCTCVTCTTTLIALRKSLKEAQKDIEYLKEQGKATTALVELTRKGII